MSSTEKPTYDEVAALRAELEKFADEAVRDAAEILALRAERDEARALLARCEEWVDREEVSALRDDQRDWRKGVSYIASALGEVDPPDLSCVRLGNAVLSLRAERDREVERGIVLKRQRDEWRRRAEHAEAEVEYLAGGRDHLTEATDGE